VDQCINHFGVLLNEQGYAHQRWLVRLLPQLRQTLLHGFDEAL
jgi:hypothetical protein